MITAILTLFFILPTKCTYGYSVSFTKVRLTIPNLSQVLLNLSYTRQRHSTFMQAKAIYYVKVYSLINMSKSLHIEEISAKFLLKLPLKISLNPPNEKLLSNDTLGELDM